MESYKIKSPKSGRFIDVNGKTYKNLYAEGYTEEYLSSLPKVLTIKPVKSVKSVKNVKSTKKYPTVVEPVVLKNEILSDDIMFNIALHSSYADIINLCRTNKNYNQHVCHNEYFWKIKYNNDFEAFNKEEHKKYKDYEIKWFHTKEENLMTLDEFKQYYFENVDSKWEDLYVGRFLDKIDADITEPILWGFGIREKYDHTYAYRKRAITDKVFNFIQKKALVHDVGQLKQLEDKVVKAIIKIVANDYKDYKKDNDTDTPEKYILEKVSKTIL